MNDKRTYIRAVLDILYFIIVYLLLQLLCQGIATIIFSNIHGTGISLQALQKAAAEMSDDGRWMTMISVISSVITIILYYRLKWSPLGRSYIRSRPWAALVWVVIATIGTLLPAEWIYEKSGLIMPEQYERLFESIMNEPWGYAAIGLMAPLAEEMVFRGAVLRTLLQVIPSKRHWTAIIISALLFGIAHFNIAQGVHAFAIGLLLGWMYYRTRSIVPGLVFHWANNSIAYALYNFFPQMNDGQLIDFFHGSTRLMAGGLFFSIMIFIPAIFQLYRLLKKAGE